MEFTEKDKFTAKDKFRKNCLNCEHFYYGDGDINDPEGFTCDKRTSEMTENEEYDFHKKMERKSYVISSKKCFEGRE